MANNITNINVYNTIKEIFTALDFAAFKHRHQKRKGFIPIPYINHPVKVSGLILSRIENPGLEMIQAALLHDTLEDTKTTYEEIQQKFGMRVAEIVAELTDDMSQPYYLRKKLQIEKAPELSYEARCIKIADKICNINDILFTRVGWFKHRKINYIKWSISVISRIRGTNKELEDEFDNLVKEAERILKIKF